MQQLTEIEAKFLKATRDLGATSPATALDTAPITAKVGEVGLTKNVAAFALQSLVGKGAVVRTPDGKWYART